MTFCPAHEIRLVRHVLNFSFQVNCSKPPTRIKTPFQLFGVAFDQGACSLPNERPGHRLSSLPNPRELAPCSDTPASHLSSPLSQAGNMSNGYLPTAVLDDDDNHSGVCNNRDSHIPVLLLVLKGARLATALFTAWSLCMYSEGCQHDIYDLARQRDHRPQNLRHQPNS